MRCPVAAVVVAHNSGRELPRCLDSLSGKVARAVVVDNGPAPSAPASLRERHPWVDWIDNLSNLGFAAAVNQGVAATSEPHVLLLNPDCELLTDLDPLVQACRHSKTAGAGGLLAGPDRAPQVGFTARSLPTPWALSFEVLGLNRIWRRNPVNRRYRLLDLDPSLERDVEQPAGAFLMLRRDALEAVGGLDERFHPVWFEDVDLCRRLADAGLAMRFVPGAVALHAGGHAVGRLPAQARLEAWYGGLLRYAEKHYASRVFGRVRLSVLVGLGLRELYWTVAGESSVTASAYGAVLRQVQCGFPSRSGAS